MKLYTFKDNYYLLLNTSSSGRNKNVLQTFCASITEFAEYVHNPEIFESNLREHGKLLIKSDVINTCLEHFVV